MNLLIFGKPNAEISLIINKIYRVDKDINICDYSNPYKVKLWKNGKKLKGEGINFLPYTIVVVINIDDDVNECINYWVNKLCRYNKKIVFIYNIINKRADSATAYSSIWNSLSDNSCIINSKNSKYHDVRYFLTLVRNS